MRTASHSIIDQIIAAARAHRPRDLTSAEHQRRNTLKNAILTFARTEDHEYILHPEQLVTSMSAAAAKVLQEQIDAFHGPRDERLHSLQ